MKNYLLALTFLISGFTSFSQSYQTVYPERETLFNNKYWGQYVGRTDSISGIQIDSSKTETGFIVYFHSPTLRGNEGSCENWLLTKTPHWIGEKTIVKANGWNIFFNKQGDSIRIKTNAAFNDTWHLADLANGDYFEAQVTEKKEMVYLSVTDSFKAISIQMKDNAGNPLSHNFNNKQIILSKSNGFIRVYDFYKFPEDTSGFQLIGITNPDLGAQNITAKEIFDFNVGDIIQTEEYSHSQLALTSEKQQKIILSKTISDDQNTITYLIETSTHYTYKEYGNSPKNYSTNKKDTIDEVIILSSWKYISGLPPQLVSMNIEDVVISPIRVDTTDVAFSPTLHYKAFNNRTVKIANPWPLFNEKDDCFSSRLIGGVVNTPHYIEGLGGEYYHNDYDDIWGTSYKKLIYYKKGSEEWGTPIDFDILLSSVPRSETVISSSVSPNPFSRSATVEINNWNKQTYYLQVIDIYGKVVMELSTDEGRFEINNDGSLSGAYTYKLFNDNNQVGTGKLMIY